MEQKRKITLPSAGIEQSGDGSGVDIGEAVLFTLGATVFWLRENFGMKSVIARVSHRDIELKIPMEEPDSSFEIRLRGIIENVHTIAISSDMNYNDLIPHFLVVDGWSWNENVFRSPIWMHDHRDVPIDEARKIRGLEWLIGTSLEIKSGHRGVSGESER